MADEAGQEELALRWAHGLPDVFAAAEAAEEPGAVVVEQLIGELSRTVGLVALLAGVHQEVAGVRVECGGDAAGNRLPACASRMWSSVIGATGSRATMP